MCLFILFSFLVSTTSLRSRQWREKQQEEIKARDEASKRRREDTIATAERDIEEFYENYAKKKERSIRDNKSVFCCSYFFLTKMFICVCLTLAGTPRPSFWLTCKLPCQQAQLGSEFATLLNFRIRRAKLSHELVPVRRTFLGSKKCC